MAGAIGCLARLGVRFHGRHNLCDRSSSRLTRSSENFPVGAGQLRGHWMVRRNHLLDLPHRMGDRRHRLRYDRGLYRPHKDLDPDYSDLCGLHWHGGSLRDLVAAGPVSLFDGTRYWRRMGGGSGNCRGGLAGGQACKGGGGSAVRLGGGVLHRGFDQPSHARLRVAALFCHRDRSRRRRIIRAAVGERAGAMAQSA